MLAPGPYPWFPSWWNPESYNYPTSDSNSNAPAMPAGIDPRLAALYQQAGLTPSERGSGFADWQYWQDRANESGWDWMLGRLGSDLRGEGPDQPTGTPQQGIWSRSGSNPNQIQSQWRSLQPTNNFNNSGYANERIYKPQFNWGNYQPYYQGNRPWQPQSMNTMNNTTNTNTAKTPEPQTLTTQTPGPSTLNSAMPRFKPNMQG